MVGRKRKPGRRKNPKDELLMGRGLHKNTIDLINYINENILNDGKEKSIRRIYYALEARKIIESSPKNYQMIKNIVKQARFHGLIHPDRLRLDKGRISRSYVYQTSKASEIINTLKNSAYGYNTNFWDYSDTVLEVWQEKETLEPDFLKICSDYNIRCETGRGDQSIRVIWNALKRWDLFLSGDKKIVVLYFGDFNPYGLNASIAIKNTIKKLSSVWNKEFANSFDKIDFNHVMLTFEDIQKYDLPENPTKQSTHKDKVIAEKFIKKYGDRNVEMDSLAEHFPEDFENRIRKSIEKYVDEDSKQKAEQRDNIVINRLEKIIETMVSDYFSRRE